MKKQSIRFAWPGLKTTARGTSVKTPLIEMQRRLYAHAEEIELANSQGLPLKPELSKWLSVALKNIACGKDADVCLGVKPHKQGVRKDGFLKEMQHKHANGLIAAATDTDDPQSVTNEKAFLQATELGSAFGTIRKNWNKKDADRDPTFSLTNK